MPPQTVHDHAETASTIRLKWASTIAEIRTGRAGDLPAPVLQTWLDRLATGGLPIGPLHAYTLDDIARAHADLEHNRVFGKLVGVIDPADLAVTGQ